MTPSYYERARGLATKTVDPTLTDQSGREQTDINIIINHMHKFGSVGVKPRPSMYGDFTAIPPDIRGVIEQARSIDLLRGQLPKELKNLTVQDLVELTPERLTTILTPPPTKEAIKTEEPKA